MKTRSFPRNVSLDRLTGNATGNCGARKTLMDSPAKPADCAPDRPRKGGEKTRLRTLADVDRRTLAGKAAFRLRDDLAADLGGWDRLSAMQRELVENTAVLGAMLKDYAAAYLTGEPVDLAEFMALTNAQRRLMADLGLERRAANITPNVREYVASMGRGA